MENNQTAARAARRFLDDRVRSDWDWPNVPQSWSASDEEVRGVSEFRERYYGESTSDHESEGEGGTTADPYKFDSPDSIGDAVEMKAQSRKRKRRAALDSEMEWNEGLARYIERRDAWTGATAVRKYKTRRLVERSPTLEDDNTSTDTPLPIEPMADAQSSTESSPAPSVEPLMPLAHPLLPDNAIRKTITPKTYPDIYSKVVLSSRTPSVPINLADMTKALVQGWKDNGEWPPKAATADPLAGRKRGAVVGVKIHNGDGEFLSHHPHVRKGVDSVKRMLHLNGHHNDAGHAIGKEG